MEYFYYPVDNRADVVESMVALFPEFCERIDRGGFYIACAMGLHRTDIAKIHQIMLLLCFKQK